MKVKKGWVFVDEVAGTPSAFSMEVKKDIPTFDKEKPLEIDISEVVLFEENKKIEIDEGKLSEFQTDSLSDYDADGNFIGGRNGKST